MDDSILLDAKAPDGTQRFYPYGEHPATLRLRQELAFLETLPESIEREKAIGYSREQLARFEIGEERAKCDYLLRYRVREAGAPSAGVAAERTEPS